MTKKVFLAADMLVAFVDRMHPQHLHAKTLMHYFASEHFALFTTPTILDHAYTQIAQDISVSLARELLDSFAKTEVNMLFPDDKDLAHTYELVTNSPTLEITFTDALQATLCVRNHIPSIATFSYIHPYLGMSAFYLPV